GLSLFFKLFFILLAMLAVGAGSQGAEIAGSRRSEYYGLILSACIGMSFAASSSELLLSFLCLQLLNTVSYFLAGYAKSSEVSIESSVKYLVFCTVSGAAFLFAAA